MKYLILIAIRNVRKNYRRSMAALLSISAAFFAAVIFDGYTVDVARQYLVGYKQRAMLGDVMIENSLARSKEGKAKPWEYEITPSEQVILQHFFEKHQAQVGLVVRNLVAQGMVSNGRISTIFLSRGYDIESGGRMRGDGWKWNATYGLPLQNVQDPQRALLGGSLARMLSCKPDHPEKVVVMKEGGYPQNERPFTCLSPSIQLSASTDSGQLNTIDLNVVGFTDGGYQETDNKYVMTSIENMQMLRNTKNIDFYSVTLADQHGGYDASAGQIEQFIKDFHAEVSPQDPQLGIMKWQDHPLGELYGKTMSLLSIFRNFVVVVVICITFLSVLNTMIKVVRERTREIGTMLSLGFSRGFILRLFLCEAFFLSVVGVGIGLLVSVLVTLGIDYGHFYYKAGILSDFVPLLIQLSPLTMILTAGGLFALTILTTAMACQNTLKQKIVSCLTYV